MKTIAVVPVYNEKGTVVSVLERLRALNILDGIVAINDGSSDGSGDIITEWSQGKDKVTVLHHPTNRGYSEALLTGFHYVLDQMESGQLSSGDAIVTIDADNQHDPAELPGFLNTLEEQKLDVVWARRDFTLYPWLKRFGNYIMSEMASIFAGFRFKDVESGYCIFRLGALKDALRFQKRDSRYSLSLTLAVALARLGYKISNEPIASVKIYRSRTRIIDGLWDTLAAATTWGRVTASLAKSSPALALKVLICILSFVGLLTLMVWISLKSIYQGSDSINNYVHVWYISKHLYNGSLTLHFFNLSSGKALTYPYGFVPWTLAALVYPIFGDLAVTWTMVLGIILVLVVVYLTCCKPNIWYLTIFVLMPYFCEALLTFQMAFVWSMLFGYLYIWALEKRSYKWAFLWLILAVGNHLVIMGPILAIYTAWAYWRRPELRRSLYWIWGFALILLIPLTWYTFTSPTVGENSSSSIALVWLWTIIPRGGLFFTPLVITWFASYYKLLARALVGLPLAITLVGLMLWVNISHDQFLGLFSNASDYYQTYLESQYYTPGAVYRVVEKNREEQGQYYFIRHGAILANEFFYESFHRQNWTETNYEKYLSEKKVDFVLMRADYLRHYHTNEGQILEELRSQGLAQIIYQDPQGRFSVYDVRAVSNAIEEHTYVEFVIG